MKKVFEGRSKVAIVVFVLSVLLLCLLIPTMIMKSKNIYDYFVGILPFDDIKQTEINSSVLSSAVLVQWGSDVTILDILLSSVMFVIALFNIAGFVSKRFELNFISIGLSIMTVCFNVYIFDSMMIIILCVLFVILNIWAYISESKLNKKKES